MFYKFYVHIFFMLLKDWLYRCFFATSGLLCFQDTILLTLAIESLSARHLGYNTHVVLKTKVLNARMGEAALDNKLQRARNDKAALSKSVGFILIASTLLQKRQKLLKREIGIPISAHNSKPTSLSFQVRMPISVPLVTSFHMGHLSFENCHSLSAIIFT